MIKYLTSLTVILALLGGTALADQPNRVLPPQTKIVIPGGPTIELTSTHFLINRETIENANVAMSKMKRLEDQLKACRERILDEPKKSSKAWWIVAGVGTALVTGYYLGAR